MEIHKNNRQSMTYLFLVFSFFLIIGFSKQVEASEDAPTIGTVSAIKFTSAEANHLAGVALDGQGYVWAWGYNLYGTLGGVDQNGIKKFNTYAGGMFRIPYFVENNIKVVQIAAGYHTNYALDDKGIVYAWGRGLEGQMGNGTTTNGNPRPVIVTSLTGKKIVKVVTSTEASSRSYALDEEGRVYGWGYGASDMIPGQSGYVSRAVEIPGFKAVAGEIKDIVIGDDHGLILNNKNEVFVWGKTTYGLHGNGKTTGSNAIEKVTFFSQQNKKVTQISANTDANLVLTEDNEVYQWGAIYNKSTATTSTISSPEKVQYDVTSSSYQPIPVTVIAGKLVSYFIDQHGRVWSWGFNMYYSFGTDGPLPDKVNTGTVKAKLQPSTMGDGDTQGVRNVEKAPVFKNVSAKTRFSSAVTSYGRHGQWSSLGDGLHPTIYDKKYMMTVGEPIGKKHDYVFPIDKEGRRLVYTVRKNANDTYSSDFLVASDEYTGPWLQDLSSRVQDLPPGLTTEASSPAIKDPERSWINISVDAKNFDYTDQQLKQLPYISKIHTYQSNTLFIDNAGNLYKTGYDGSGSIAWGWDYSVYESNTAGNKAIDGLYNMYTYEVMFMRGSPRLVEGGVSIDAPKKKHYLSKKESDKVKVDLNLGAGYYDEQLNITVVPELKQAKYIIMPYDGSDDTVKIKNPSKEDFDEAYENSVSKGYKVVDLAATNGWVGLKSEIDKALKLSDESIELSDNAVVWVMLETSVYSATTTTISTETYDNFYTETTIANQGLNFNKSDEMVYKPINKAIEKVMSAGDSETTLYGFPVDKHHKIIKDPTYGYDKVKVSRIPDKDIVIADKELNEVYPDLDITFFWKWHTPQTETKTYTLNGVDKPDNGKTELTNTTGELKVPDFTKEGPHFNHTFYYDENPKSKYNLHFIAVDKMGNILPKEEFNESTESLLRKGILEKRKPPLLKNSVDFVATKFKVLDVKPPTTQVDVTNFMAFKELTAEYRVPLDERITDITLIYMYEQPIRDVTLHIRQLVINGSGKVSVPRDGFVTLDTLEKDEKSLSDKNNVIINSGLSTTDIPYTKVGLKADSETYQFLASYTEPQYYNHVGYRLSETQALNEHSPLIKSRTQKVDYTSLDEQWLTIYIEPTTDEPLNYSWYQLLNPFGKIYYDKTK